MQQRSTACGPFARRAHRSLCAAPKLVLNAGDCARCQERARLTTESVAPARARPHCIGTAQSSLAAVCTSRGLARALFQDRGPERAGMLWTCAHVRRLLCAAHGQRARALRPLHSRSAPSWSAGRVAAGAEPSARVCDLNRTTRSTAALRASHCRRLPRIVPVMESHASLGAVGIVQVSTCECEAHMWHQGGMQQQSPERVARHTEYAARARKPQRIAAAGIA